MIVLPIQQRSRLGYALSGVVLLTASLAYAPSAAAQAPPRLTAALENIDYNVLGTTSVRRFGEAFLLQTRGLRASGTVNCSNNQPCLSLGLDGATVTIEQDLGIVIIGDVLTPVADVKIRGQSAGDLGITDGTSNTIHRFFSGEVRGSGVCTTPLCGVTLAIEARSPNGDRLALDLAGTLDLGGGLPSWSSLLGSGFMSAASDTEP